MATFYVFGDRPGNRPGDNQGSRQLVMSVSWVGSEGPERGRVGPSLAAVAVLFSSSAFCRFSFR